MAEEHAMEVRWSGDAVLGNLMAEAARQRGFSTDVEASNGTVVIVVKVNDNDLQSMRDRVDELLVAFSALEEAHEG